MEPSTVRKVVGRGVGGPLPAGCRYGLIAVLVLAVTAAADPHPLGVDVLVLLPLTGPEEVRGRAQAAGVRLALRGLGLNPAGLEVGRTGRGREDDHGRLIGTDLRIFYNDTRCDRSKEDSVIINRLIDSSRKLLVIGGSCIRSDINQSKPWKRYHKGVLGNRVPQVSFGRHFSDDSYDMTVRPLVINAHRHLADWLLKEGWHQVALVHDLSFPAWQEQKILRHYLRERQVNVTLAVEDRTPRFATVLRESMLRVVVLYMKRERSMDVLCHLARETETMPGRFVWAILVEDSVNMLEVGCAGAALPRDVVVFNVQTAIPDSKVYRTFTSGVHDVDNQVLEVTGPDAAYAHDATMLALGTLGRLPWRQTNSRTQQEFADQFWKEMFRTSLHHGVTGPLVLDDQMKIRRAIVQLYTYYDGKLALFNATAADGDQADEVAGRVELDGVPLGLLAVMCSLALLGIVYTLAIMAFNILKRTERMIKMTSPNMNLVITTGALLGYVAIVTMGIDSSLVSVETMAKLLQASTFLLAFGYSLVFGSLFAKAWRVFFIFKNLNANGKNTRDEHLLCGVIILLFVDVVILLPWATADPITCSRVYLSTSFQVSPPTDVVYQSDTCTSQFQTVWVVLMYGVKGCVLAAGLYFTFQTRHVTLPTLKDAREIYIIIYTASVLAFLTLPVLLTARVGTRVKYAVGALAIFVTVTATLTLAFIPKIYLVWKRSDKSSPESIRFRFSESLRRTQRHLGSCTSCCSLAEGEDNEKYAQEVLGSEMDTLKRTIKEKDATIRELTDRLYFGTEKKLHEYICSPRNRTVLGHSPEDRRAPSYSPEDHVDRRVPSYSPEDHVDRRVPSYNPEDHVDRRVPSYSSENRRMSGHGPEEHVERSRRVPDHIPEDHVDSRVPSHNPEDHMERPRRSRAYSSRRRRTPAYRTSSEVNQQNPDRTEYPSSSVDSSPDTAYDPHTNMPVYQHGVRTNRNPNYPAMAAVTPVALSVHNLSHKHNRRHPSHRHWHPQHSPAELDIPSVHTTQRPFIELDVIDSTINSNDYITSVINTKQRTPSPNHDSAIDNNSPSSVGSEQETFPDSTPKRPVHCGAGFGHGTLLDLDAIENEATENYTSPATGCQVSAGRSPISNGQNQIRPHYERRVAVSEI